MKSIFNEQQINFMKENYLTMSYKEIADILGFTERQVRGKLNNLGFTKLRKINDNYFDTIDTSLKAYFLPPIVNNSLPDFEEWMAFPFRK